MNRLAFGILALLALLLAVLAIFVFACSLLRLSDRRRGTGSVIFVFIFLDMLSMSVTITHWLPLIVITTVALGGVAARLVGGTFWRGVTFAAIFFLIAYGCFLNIPYLQLLESPWRSWVAVAILGAAPIVGGIVGGLRD